MHLVEARARHRVTQWDLRQKTGIHQSKISLIERGYVAPSEKERQKIAKALGMSEADIEWPRNERSRVPAENGGCNG